MIAIIILFNFIVLWYTKYSFILSLVSNFRHYIEFIDFLWDPLSGKIIFAFVSGFSILRLLRDIVRRHRLKRMAKAKRCELKKRKIEKIRELQYMDHRKWTIMLHYFHENYKKNLMMGKITMGEARKVFQFIALLKDIKTNAIVEIVPDVCTIAEEIDLYNIEERKLVGYVLFISENFSVKNCYSTSGLTSFTDSPPSSYDCYAVRLLKHHGALPLCTTNVSQYFGLSTFNPINGQTTLNNRETGGDSGGAACMIASLNSEFAIGIGLDTWGSLRMASAYNGCITLRPSHGRHLSLTGSKNPDKFMANNLSSVGGFITNSVSTLAKTWKIVWNDNAEASEYKIYRMPWRYINTNRKMRIGYFTCDDQFHPSPSCARAVLYACDLLKELDYEVVLFPSPCIKEVSELYLGQINVRGAINTLNEDLVSGHFLYKFYYLSLIPFSLRSRFLSKITGFPLFYPSETTEQYLDIRNRTDCLIRKYLTLWDDAGLDVLITPGSLTPAPPPDVAKNHYILATPYISWSLFNMPAGIVPVTRVTQKDIDYVASIKWKQSHKYIKKSSPAVGMPLSVQVVGKPFEEEKVLYVMETLEKLAKSHVSQTICAPKK